MSEIKSRPIPFSPEMVRALIGGRKTQTRRIVRVQPPSADYEISTLLDCVSDRKNIGRQHWILRDGLKIVDGKQPFFSSPFGEVGEHLWVREAWRLFARWDESSGSYLAQNFPDFIHNFPIRYEADGAETNVKTTDFRWGRYRHARFMPEWASRLTLEVTRKRPPERLHDISEADAIAEGVEATFCAACDESGIELTGEHKGLPCADCSGEGRISACSHFQSLWNSINGPDSWDLNPWVWPGEFKLLENK